MLFFHPINNFSELSRSWAVIQFFGDAECESSGSFDHFILGFC